MGGLQSISETGSVPKSRLAAADARSLLATLIKEDKPAALKRSKAQALIDGNPPYSDDELRKKGQGFIPNVNWGGAAARDEAASGPYFDIISSPPTIVTGDVYYGDPFKRSAWADRISEHMHCTLFEWDGFVYNMLLHQSQLVRFGIGPCMFRDWRDWRFTALKRRAVLVPADSQADISALEILFVRDPLRSHELFEYISNKETAPKAGWNVQATMDALKDAKPIDAPSDDYEAIQDRFRSNAYGWGYNQTKMIPCAHAFVKEIDGRVSHHILTENKDGDYLMSSIGRYESMSDAVWVCFGNIGNGDFQGSKGLASQIYHFGTAQNHLNNSLLLNAIAGSQVLFQAETPEMADRIPGIELSWGRVIPPGISIQQVNLGAGIQAALSVSREFSMQESSNTGAYKTQQLAPRGVERTATEIEAEIGEKSQLTNTKVAYYLMQCDRLFKAIYKRLTRNNILDTDPGGKEALEFQRKLKEDGIPKQAIENFVPKIARPIGNGSSSDRIMKMRRIREHYQDMPARKRAVFVRDMIAYEGGSRDLAERYGPDVEPTGPTVSEKLVMLENAAIQQGADPETLFSPDDDHATHFEIHRDFVGGILQNAPDDPVKSFQVVSEMIPHMEAHLQGVRSNPMLAKTKGVQYAQELKEIKSAAMRLKPIAERALEAQQQPQMDAEMMKAQADISLKKQIAKNDMSIKQAKAQQQMTLKDASTAQRMRHTAEKQMMERDAQNMKDEMSGEGMMQ